jgi:hypothetical protein
LFFVLLNKVLNFYKTTERKTQMARKKAPTRRDTVVGGGQWQGYGEPYFTTAGRRQFAAGSSDFADRIFLLPAVSCLLNNALCPMPL